MDSGSELFGALLFLAVIPLVFGMLGAVILCALRDERARKGPPPYV